MPTISKSRYVSGVQCEKKLYYDIYGGAGGLEHIRPELQINRGRIFLTTSIMELTQC